MKTVFVQFRQHLELIRFRHTVFALPFAMYSAILAWQETPFRWRDFLGILLAMVFARSSAMAFNRIVDRKIDAENPRTEKRHIPAGLLSVRQVACFTFLSSLLFVLNSVLFLPNLWPLFLSVPVLLFLLGYSYAKRFTFLCHYWLSTALMLSPMAAWIAIRGNLSLTPFLLGVVIFFWVGGFDIIYACQDVEYDKAQRLKSIPARWGMKNALRIAAISHFLTILALLAMWFYASLGLIFLIGVIVVGILLVYEHFLVSADDLGRVNHAFFRVNAVVSLGILAVGIADLVVSSRLM